MVNTNNENRLLPVKEKIYDFKIGDKEIKARIWNSNDKKDYLTLREKGDVTDKKLYNILIKPCLTNKKIVLTPNEQTLLILKIREKAIGETFEDTLKCHKCGTETEEKISIDYATNFKPSNYKSIEIKEDDSDEIYLKIDFKEIETQKERDKLDPEKGLVNYIFTEFILHIDKITFKGQEYNNSTFKEKKDFIDSLSVKIYDELFEKYEEMIDTLDIIYTKKCEACGEELEFDYSDKDNQIPGLLWI